MNAPATAPQTRIVFAASSSAAVGNLASTATLLAATPTTQSATMMNGPGFPPPPQTDGLAEPVSSRTAWVPSALASSGSGDDSLLAQKSSNVLSSVMSAPLSATPPLTPPAAAASTSHAKTAPTFPASATTLGAQVPLPTLAAVVTASPTLAAGRDQWPGWTSAATNAGDDAMAIASPTVTTATQVAPYAAAAQAPSDSAVMQPAAALWTTPSAIANGNVTSGGAAVPAPLTANQSASDSPPASVATAAAQLDAAVWLRMQTPAENSSASGSEIAPASSGWSTSETYSFATQSSAADAAGGKASAELTNAQESIAAMAATPAAATGASPAVSVNAPARTANPTPAEALASGQAQLPQWLSGQPPRPTSSADLLNAVSRLAAAASASSVKAVAQTATLPATNLTPVFGKESAAFSPASSTAAHGAPPLSGGAVFVGRGEHYASQDWISKADPNQTSDQSGPGKAGSAQNGLIPDGPGQTGPRKDTPGKDGSNNNAAASDASSPAASSATHTISALEVASTSPTASADNVASPTPGITSLAAAMASDAGQKSGDTRPSQADLAPAPATPDPSASATGPVQTAHLIDRLGSAEMRIGMNTAAFGSVEVRTVVRAGDVGVTIGSERGDLRSLLASEMPGIAATLGQQNLRLDGVRFLQHGLEFYSGMSSGSDAQPRPFAPPRTYSQPGLESEPGPDEPAEPMPPPIRPSHGLSVHA